MQFEVESKPNSVHIYLKIFHLLGLFVLCRQAGYLTEREARG